MFPALRPILNKGGAGRYISRAESVDRLQPIAERHLSMLRHYDGALAALPDGPIRERLAAMAPYLRTETAKVSETILSLGGAPPTGVDHEPASATDGDTKSVLNGLLDAEKSFDAALREEIDAVHHHERTRAILGHNAEASVSRLDLLRSLLADAGR